MWLIQRSKFGGRHDYSLGIEYRYTFHIESHEPNLMTYFKPILKDD